MVRCRSKVRVAIAGALVSVAACEFPPAPPVVAKWGPRDGDWGFALGGGAVSPNLDAGSASGAVDVFCFTTPATTLVFRHAGTFTDDGRDTSAMSTRFGFAWSPIASRLDPFVGVGTGYAYGESINESWIVGGEIGVRYWVQPRAFVQLVGGYDHFFTRTEDETEFFENAAFTAAIALGVLF